MADHRDDPFDLSVPPEWSVAVGEDRVVYESPDGTVRVTVRELSKVPRLYWWVDVATRSDDGEWVRRAVGPGATFRDPEDAAATAQASIDAVEAGVDFAAYPPASESPSSE